MRLDMGRMVTVVVVMRMVRRGWCIVSKGRSTMYPRRIPSFLKSILHILIRMTRKRRIIGIIAVPSSISRVLLVSWSKLTPTNIIKNPARN